MGRVLAHFQPIKTEGFFSPFKEIKFEDIKIFEDGVFRTIYLPQPFLHPGMLDGFVCRRLMPALAGALAIASSPLAAPGSRTGSLCPDLPRIAPAGEGLMAAFLPEIIKKCAKRAGKRAVDCETVIAAGGDTDVKIIKDICANFKYVSIAADDEIEPALIDELWADLGASVRIISGGAAAKGDIWIFAGGKARPAGRAIGIDMRGGVLGAVNPTSVYIETDGKTKKAAAALGGSTAAQIEAVLTFYYGAKADFKELFVKNNFRIHIL